MDQSHTEAVSANEFSPSRGIEILVGLLLIVASMILVAYWARQFDFYGDDWDFLATRDLADPSSLLRHYAGHLTLTAATITAALRDLVGFDYWPMWFLIRLIGHAGLGLLLWRAWLRRGANWLVATGFFAVFLVIGSSYWQKPSNVGNYVSLAVAVAAALLISTRESPSWFDRAWLAILLLIGLSTASVSIATTIALFLVLLLTGRLTRWWPSFLVPAIAYGTWYAIYGPNLVGLSSITSGDSPDAAELINLVPELVARTLSSVVGVNVPFNALPVYVGILGALLGIGLVAWIAYLLRRGSFGPYEAVLCMAALIYLGMLVGIRLLEIEGAVRRPHYHFTAGTLLLAALVPQIRIPEGRAGRTLAALILGAILAGNLVALNSGLEIRGEHAALGRIRAETAGAMMLSGEPVAAPQVRLGTPVLTPNRIAGMMERGFVPHLHQEAELQTRGFLRMAVLPGDADSTLGGENCVAVSDPIEQTLSSQGTFTVFSIGAKITVSWNDSFGEGERALAPSPEPYLLTLAEPRDTATWTFSPLGDEVTLCTEERRVPRG
jgi:hypothetical protein